MEYVEIASAQFLHAVHPADMIQERQSRFLKIILKIDDMHLGIMDVVLHPPFQERLISDQQIIFLFRGQLHPRYLPVNSYWAHLPRRMGLEGKPIVIRRRCLRSRLRRFRCRFIIFFWFCRNRYCRWSAGWRASPCRFCRDTVGCTGPRRQPQGRPCGGTERKAQPACAMRQPGRNW